MQEPVGYHGDEASDKLEVVQVVGVDVRRRIDLQTVVVLVGVLEQAVHGVEHFVRQQQEPLPASAKRSQ